LVDWWIKQRRTFLAQDLMEHDGNYFMIQQLRLKIKKWHTSLPSVEGVRGNKLCKSMIKTPNNKGYEIVIIN
jgi:hypothetical protein